MTVLEACCDRGNKLAHLTNDMGPGFASMSLRICKWRFQGCFERRKMPEVAEGAGGVKDYSGASAAEPP